MARGYRKTSSAGGLIFLVIAWFAAATVPFSASVPVGPPRWTIAAMVAAFVVLGAILGKLGGIQGAGVLSFLALAAGGLVGVILKKTGAPPITVRFAGMGTALGLLATLGLWAGFILRRERATARRQDETWRHGG